MIGVLQSATKRSKDSSENGSKSSKEPPPLVIIITSTSGLASSSASAALTSETAAAFATATSRISNLTLGQRRLAFSTTSFPASLFRPQIKPTTFGRKGNAFFRSKSKRPSAANKFFNASSRAINSPTPTWRISEILNESEPFLVHQVGFERITTRALVSSGAIESKTFLKQRTEMLISALVSRSRIKIVGEPGLTFISDSSPSIQTSLRPSMMVPIRSEIARTVNGFSGCST